VQIAVSGQVVPLCVSYLLHKGLIAGTEYILQASLTSSHSAAAACVCVCLCPVRWLLWFGLRNYTKRKHAKIIKVSAQVANAMGAPRGFIFIFECLCWPGI
jgi:hypothetical protein